MRSFILGFDGLLIYFIVCVCAVLPVRLFVRMRTETFRKTLHFILLGSFPVIVFSWGDWRYAAAACAAFAVVVYPILFFAERLHGYSRLLTERRAGELKRSLLVVFAMFAIVISVCWGLAGDRLLAVASVYAWGFGDAAAALVGTRCGRHPIRWRLVKTRKSAEGSAAMFAVSFISVLTVLLIRGGMRWYGYAAVSLAAALVSAATELLTPDGMDTITCPLAAMIVLLPLVYLFGGIAA